MKKLFLSRSKNLVNIILLSAVILSFGTTVFSKPATKTDKPLSILILAIHPQMGKKYAQELSDAGIQVVNTNYFQTFTYDFLKKFNVIIIDEFPRAGSFHGLWGQKELHLRKNMELIKRYLKEGGGVLVYTNLADCGGPRAGGWNQKMKPWGIQLKQACVTDPSLGFDHWMRTNSICWTENINKKHPVTKDLNRIYYPAANLRWDECYTDPPLVCDENWTPIVQCMPGARVGNVVDRKWVFQPDQEESPVLAATRSDGKGRLAVVSINPFYTHRYGYTLNPPTGEMHCGRCNGMVLKTGNGNIPSDTGKMLMNLYSWLGNNAKMGFGGYKTGEPIETVPVQKTDEEKQFTRVLDIENMPMPKSWQHAVTKFQHNNATYYAEFFDPRSPGKVKYFKALVGVHTDFSDGTGTVEDYVKAAKKAGYSMIVFTENFAKLTPASYAILMKQCKKYTDENFYCLPGYEVLDQDRNSFILAGAPKYLPASWLSEDGKRLIQTQMVFLLLYDTLTIIHRPESCPLSMERLKHFQGVSVYTYRKGKLIDNSLNTYMWQVQNGSNPHPVVVHEVFSPDEVALAAKAGFQQILPADTVLRAGHYFRSGQSHYFEAPSRYMISEGPIVYDWIIRPKDAGPVEENRKQFRLDIGVESVADLKYVKLYDGFNLMRKWLPKNQKKFHTSTFFRHDRQYDLFVLAEDMKGRKVITNAVRTVAGRYHNRCGDRQNWLGHVALYYTGTDALGDLRSLVMPIEGTEEGQNIFTPVRGTCMAVKCNYPFTTNEVVLSESIIDEKYVRAVFKDVVYDAKPSMISKLSSVYEAKLQRWSFTPGKPKMPYLSVVKYDITLKRPVEPRNPNGLFPKFSRLFDKKYAWYENGKLKTGDIPKRGIMEVPVGGMAGGFIALTPGLAVENGWIGIKTKVPTNGQLPIGTEFKASLLYPGTPTPRRVKENVFCENPETWLKSLGIGIQSPYQLKISKGKPIDSVFPEKYQTVNGGLAGSVSKTAEIPVKLPLQLAGINKNWPTGIWRPENRNIDYTGVYENSAYVLLDVGKTGKFFAGNLVTTDNPDLIISIIKWTKNEVSMELHNPTSKPITATVKSAPEITNLKPVNQKVTVAAGSNIKVK